jgi:transposase-like protein
MGRPSKFTPECREAILAAIRGGNFREVAAKAGGVSAATLRAWLSMGKDEDNEEHAAFRAAFLKAESDAEITAVADVIKAGRVDAAHLKWWLERKFRERWGPDGRRIRELQKQLEELTRLVNERVMA